MRIAIFTDNYKPGRGGTAVSVDITAEWLRRMGEEVYIFAPYTKEAAFEENALLFRSVCITLGGTSVECAIPWSSRLKSAFSELGIEVIHTFSPFFVGLFARYLSHCYRVPLVLTCQSMWPHYLDYLPMGRLLVRTRPTRMMLEYLTGRYIRWYCDNCDCVVVPTTPTANLLQVYGVSSTRIELIPVGFDVDAFERVQSLNVRDTYGIPSDCTLLVTVSRLAREKNLEFLIRAVGPVLKMEKTHLLIVGDGIGRLELERLCCDLGIRHRVTFTGWIDHDKIPAVLKASDIFVFSSLSEAQGFAVWESLISGCPVVAINAPGPADVITSGREGYLTSDSADEFSHAVRRLVENHLLRREISRNAKIKGSQFSATLYVRRLMALYRSLIPATTRP